MAILKPATLPKVDTFFDRAHEFIPQDKLNEIRMKLIADVAENTQIRPTIYSLAKAQINAIVGNELSMQRAPNLSIQLPKDSSSLLYVHSDVWSGNSPFEVVFWLPLVNSYKTKSMFILPKKYSDEVYKDFKRYSKLNAEDFFQAIKPNLVFVDVPFGSGVIFSHVLPHGNRINEENETRWTMNIRFKSLLSPYGSKEVGESFLPITTKPITRIGHEYRKPECEY